MTSMRIRLAALAIASMSFAGCTNRVGFRFRDAETHEPLAGAIVDARPYQAIVRSYEARSTTTDSDGVAHLELGDTHWGVFVFMDDESRREFRATYLLPLPGIRLKPGEKLSGTAEPSGYKGLEYEMWRD